MTETRSPDRAKPRLWATVARQEVGELWRGPKGLSVLLGFSILMAVLAYSASADAGINLLDARESVGIIVQSAIAFGTLAALVVSADAISGERERGTLESLLVTPVPRRGLVIGKLLAATTMWLATLLVALPFVAVMAKGPGIAVDGLLVLFIVGALVAAALTALGLAISSVALSNRVSLAGSVAALLMLAAPSQLPGIKASGVVGSILVKANPVSAGLRMADNILVKQQPWSDQVGFVISPIVAAVTLTGLAVMMSARLELGGAR